MIAEPFQADIHRRSQRKTQIHFSIEDFPGPHFFHFLPNEKNELCERGEPHWKMDVWWLNVNLEIHII